MSNIKSWISATRPRTLFLAMATVILGSGLAWHDGAFSTKTLIWTFLLAVSIQILANFANDLGDYEKGTDTTGKREGPMRALQSGKISREQMKTALSITIAIVCFSGAMSVGRSLGWNENALPMLAIGACCIAAALFYTMGKHAYGYRGWGDLFAFLFFGPVPVIGTYYLHMQSIGWQPVLPAIGLGLISTMILNVNNMRDIDNDRASGKMTVAVRLGLKNARFYHTLLTFIMFSCFIAYNQLYEPTPWYRSLYTAVFIIYFRVLTHIHKKQGHALDPYLKLTSLPGFLLAVAFVICINI